MLSKENKGLIAPIGPNSQNKAKIRPNRAIIAPRVTLNTCPYSPLMTLWNLMEARIPHRKPGSLGFKLERKIKEKTKENKRNNAKQ